MNEDLAPPPRAGGYGLPWFRRWWGIALIAAGAVLAGLASSPALLDVGEPSDDRRAETGPGGDRVTTNPTQHPSSTPPLLDDTSGASPRGDDAPVIRQGRVIDIVDGDTFDLFDGTTVRIAIADTPEVYFGTELCGPEASDFAASFLANQIVAIYRPEKAPETDDNGRLLGEVVRVSDGASLNVALVLQGLATVDERFAEEDPDLARRLRAAADNALDPECAAGDSASPDAPPPPQQRERDGVVIDLVREDGPGNDVEFGDSEYVQLRNTGDGSVDISGWVILDDANNRVTVGSGFTIAPGDSFRVYSGPGESDPTARYYASLSQAYLNNSGGDTIRLLDATGKEVARFSY